MTCLVLEIFEVKITETLSCPPFWLSSICSTSLVESSELVEYAIYFLHRKSPLDLETIENIFNNLGLILGYFEVIGHG